MLGVVIGAVGAKQIAVALVAVVVYIRVEQLLAQTRHHDPRGGTSMAPAFVMKMDCSSSPFCKLMACAELVMAINWLER